MQETEAVSYTHLDLREVLVIGETDGFGGFVDLEAAGLQQFGGALDAEAVEEVIERCV